MNARRALQQCYAGLVRPVSRARSTQQCRGFAADVLPSLISTANPDFAARKEGMDVLVSDLETRLADARLGGGEKAAARMRARGKMLPRERYVLAPTVFANDSTTLAVSCLHMLLASFFVYYFSSRLSALLDPGAPFLELSALAAHEVYGDERIPGAGMVTGIGRVSGRPCVIVVNDPTVKGGSYYPLTVTEGASH